MISAGGRVLQQIAVMRTCRVAGFSGDIGHHRPVPVAHIEDLAVGCAAGLLESGSARRIDGECVAGTRNGAAMKLCGVQRMGEVDLMEASPLPAVEIWPL